MKKNSTYKIIIKGRVQGVGFRPFIYNLAIEHLLGGTVYNNDEGVVIMITTTDNGLVRFLEEVNNHVPDVAIIQTVTYTKIQYVEYSDFNIILSSHNSKVNLPLTPDFAVCTTCQIEVLERSNRRYNYPFTTCVHCGPRYSITTAFPFDRDNTSLHSFSMCSTCKTEYTSPENRRFHSQTNSCATCGIQLSLASNTENVVETNNDLIFNQTSQLLADGKILAVKNTNGYILLCDANKSDTINRLRKRKNRRNKPFAVLYPTIDMVMEDFELSILESSELTSKIAPIVILKDLKIPRISLSDIAPNLQQIGIMLPSSTLLHLIITNYNRPLIATSGNLHGSPIISDIEEAKSKLKNVCDYYLHHNLDVVFPQDDSVVRCIDEQKIILRRSRGFAPNYMAKHNTIDTTSEQVLAMGAHLKSTFTMVPNEQIYVSQYFGNLDNYDVSLRYKSTIDRYFNLFGVTPDVILIDKHSQYQSSELGKELAAIHQLTPIEIQHHKAHFASVLGEHNLFDNKEKVLGVVWDGTGYGDDKQIWGGEFFIYDNYEMHRHCHFSYYDWIANDKMSKEPRVSLLCLTTDENKDLIQKKFSSNEWKIYNSLIENSNLKTSSVGRLFDAVASLLDLIDINTYEAQAAMRLESLARAVEDRDCVDFLEGIAYDNIPTILLIKQIYNSLESGISKPIIARSFLYTLAKIIINIANRNDIRIIACSGGVFQNGVLIEILLKFVKESQLELKLNSTLPPNDENISFGQLMYFKKCK